MLHQNTKEDQEVKAEIQMMVLEIVSPMTIREALMLVSSVESTDVIKDPVGILKYKYKKLKDKHGS